MTAENLKASSIVSSTGFASSPTVAELDTDDTSYAEPSNNNTDIDLVVGFALPTDALTIGANLQTFTAVVRPNAVSPGSGTATARIELYESGNIGNPLATSSSVNITSSSGDVAITLLWNASLLTAGSGADVECHLVGSRSGGSPNTRIAVAVDSIGWDADYTVPASAFALALDAGAIATTGVDLNFSRTFALALDSDTYTLTGIDLGLMRDYTLPLDAGAIATTGVDLAFSLGYSLVLSAGAITTTGVDLTFGRTYTLALDADTISVTGSELALSYTRTLSIDSGVQNQVGTDVALSLTTLPLSYKVNVPANWVSYKVNMPIGYTSYKIRV